MDVKMQNPCFVLLFMVLIPSCLFNTSGLQMMMPKTKPAIHHMV